MGIMAKTNILVAVLMAAQFLLAPFAGSFFSELSHVLPEGVILAGLLAGNQLVSVLVPVLLFLLLVSKTDGVKAKEILSIAPISGRNILLIAAMSFFIQPLIGVLSLLSQMFFANNIGAIAETAVSKMPYPFMIGVFAFLPAIVEELALRGAVLGSCRYEISPKRAILINGLFFGMIHLDGQQFLYAAVLGAFFSFLVISTGSIFSAIIAHFTINASQVTLAYVLMGMYETLENELQKTLGEPVTEAFSETVYASNQANALSEFSNAAGVSSITALLSLAIAAAFIFFSYAIFMRIFSKFVKDNPASASLSSQTENEAANFMGVPPINGEPLEIIFLKIRLKNRASLEKTFYLSLSVPVLTYFIIMCLIGCDVTQILFLFVVFTVLFSGFFLLRIRR